jgi:hypothetical protein
MIAAFLGDLVVSSCPALAIHDQCSRHSCALISELVLSANALDGVEHGSYGWREGSDGVGDGYAPNEAFAGEVTAQEVVLVDDHGAVVGEGDTAAGGDQGLDFDGFVAVAGQPPRRIEPVSDEDVLGQVGCAAVVRPDPGLAGKVGWVDQWGLGHAVSAGAES